jgi:hypothetical protein
MPENTASSPIFVKKGPKEDAWGSATKNGKKLTKEELMASGLPEGGIPKLPGDAAITVGLMQVADALSRKILPWQAACCPRAVETMRDLRQSSIQVKHHEFMSKMAKQLEDKVMGFLNKKDIEIEKWMQNEIDSWNKTMIMGESGEVDFLRADKIRVLARIGKHEVMRQKRELSSASNIDEMERDTTREQLVNFRRLVRHDEGNQASDQNAEIRSLNASIASAQAKALAQQSVSVQDINRYLLNYYF